MADIQHLAIGLANMHAPAAIAFSDDPIDAYAAPKAGFLYYHTPSKTLWKSNSTAVGDLEPVGFDKTLNIVAKTAAYTLDSEVLHLAKNSALLVGDAAAVTVTVPPDSVTDFPIGYSLLIYRSGAGTVTIAPGSGVSVDSAGSLALPSQYSQGTLLKTAANSWIFNSDSPTSGVSSGPLELEDNGSSLSTAVKKLNFTNFTITEPVADEFEITAPSGSGGSGGSGGLTFVGQQIAVGGETELTFSGLSGATEHYLAQVVMQGTTDDYVDLVVNGDDTAANYKCYIIFERFSGGQVKDPQTNNHIGFAYTPDGFCHLTMNIQRHTDDCAHWWGEGMYLDDGSGDPSFIRNNGFRGPNTTEITSLGFKMASGTILANSVVKLYKYSTV